jgi:hypothetical protein
MHRRHSVRHHRRIGGSPVRRRRHSSDQTIIPLEEQEARLNRRLIVARFRAWSHR